MHVSMEHSWGFSIKSMPCWREKYFYIFSRETTFLGWGEKIRREQATEWGICDVLPESTPIPVEKCAVLSLECHKQCESSTKWSETQRDESHLGNQTRKERTESPLLNISSESTLQSMLCMSSIYYRRSRDSRTWKDKMILILRKNLNVHANADKWLPRGTQLIEL